jgi:hypothetical protein
MTPSFSGLAYQVTVAEVGPLSVTATSVGVLGDSGPVRSPHAATKAAISESAATLAIALRIFFVVINVSLIVRISFPA